MADIHKGDIGTRFKCKIVDQDKNIVDLSGASVREILFKKPDTTTMAKVAALSGDGTDGYIEYISVADDLNVVGDWKIQAYVKTPEGEWSTDLEVFKVNTNIKRT